MNLNNTKTILEEILNSIGPVNLYNKIDKPLDKLLQNFSYNLPDKITHKEFNIIIGKFYKYLGKNGLEIQRELTDSEALKEVSWLLEKYYQGFEAPGYDGRQGKVPPAYRRIGACVHFYARPSVMSVELEAGETAETGKILGVRLAAGYHEEPIESLQVEHRTVPAATGPCRVGIKTTLRRSDVAIGQAVFTRLP